MNCCFCERSHDIRNCDDNQLTYLEENLVNWRQNNLATIHNNLRNYLNQFQPPLLIALAKKKGMTGETFDDALEYIYNSYIIPRLDTQPSYMVQEMPDPRQFVSEEDEYDSDGSLPDLIDVDSDDEQHPRHYNNYLLTDERDMLYSDIMNQWISFGQNESIDRRRVQPYRKWRMQQQHQIIQRKETERHGCGICYEEISIDNMVTFSCSHYKCDTCFISHLKTTRTKRTAENPICAFCRAPIESITLRNETIISELQEYII